MNYRDQLTPWAIFQRLSTGQNVCFSRFRTRTEADAYMSILRQGSGKFEVVYDLPQPQPQEVQG
ncbi:hypothetical protein [Nostoc sp. 'Lobaria pulmonaria (5183) cyanobiont']|uniref:hypothetical protein n=1 Tax=Nostoc sp. 'Lobaria pulmonaria (5183) cyanobiont' TaxID=1618022 RepID=UPI000CF3511F|nr:hypothetical protein [Nostoc sp. 'Lobaria pulmonaria (5183) cyanobiont']AVH73832.1 hypothetical protein NLP_5534 [Nostoc sp. 'Lobaria pulmonaria (5183) cyanobiont']